MTSLADPRGSGSLGEPKEPRQVVERLVELFKTNNAELAAQLYAEDVVIDDPMYGEQVVGRDAALRAFGDWFRAFLIVDFEALALEGDPSGRVHGRAAERRRVRRLASDAFRYA